MARAMEHQAALLLGRLGRDEPHVGPGDRLADGLRRQPHRFSAV